MDDITDKNSSNFIPVLDRVAVFDLDGTLIGEQYPIYFEWLMFTQRILKDPTFTPDEEMVEVAKAIVETGENRSIPEDLEERNHTYLVKHLMV